MKLEGYFNGRLKKDFERVLQRGGVVTKHADRFTAHVPDMSVAWKRTGWLEVKTSTKLNQIEKMKGAQLDTIRRLRAAIGDAWIVVFVEWEDKRETLILDPRTHVTDDLMITGALQRYDGHAFATVVSYVLDSLNDYHGT